MPPQLLKRLALNLLVLPWDMYQLARDMAARARKQYRIILNEEDGGLKQLGCVRAAIVAAHPSLYSTPFLANLLDGLAANGFFVLIVATGNMPPAIKDMLLPRCHHLIERFPAGRDFGSYKIGWQWIQKRLGLKDLDAVAFVNDSLYYPHNIVATIKQTLAQTGDWLCLFENFQTLYHTQSFFQIFRGAILRSPTFLNFWRNYAPTCVRMRIIKKGEVGLTRALYDAGFQPQATFNTLKLRTDIRSALDVGTISEPFQDVLNLTLGFESRRLPGSPPVRKEDFLALLPADVAHKVSVLVEKYNPTHSVGLLCNYLYEAPLKRDICYRDIVTMSDLITLAAGFSAEEKEAMFADLHRKGVPANFAGIRKIPQKLLWTTGRI